MSLRQRHVPQEKEEDTTSALDVREFVKRVKALDLYAKPEEDHTIQTTSGGFTSLISLTFMCILFLSELSSYLTVRTSHSILVDTRTNQKLAIHFNFTFHSLPCSASAIDVMDVSGEQQLDADTNIERWRLNSKGERIAKANLAHDHDTPPNANLPQSIQQQLQLQLQLPPGASMHGHGHGEGPHEGCNIAGSLLVNKVAGNVHIALGASHVRDVKHVHQFVLHEMLAFNASHTIHHLSFGDPYPGQLQPLNGVSNIIQSGTAHFQYFLKIVPTVYVDESSYVYTPSAATSVSASKTYSGIQSGSRVSSSSSSSSSFSSSGAVLDTNQYSVTEQTHAIHAEDALRPDGRKIPGLFFVYDLSPFMVRVRKYHRRFGDFATSCAALIGGVLTVMGIVDSLVFHISKAWQRFQSEQLHANQLQHRQHSKAKS